MVRTRKRRSVVSFQRHNGNIDEHGQPTYDIENDWLAVTVGFDNSEQTRQLFWPCEWLTTGGGEMIRGRQVQAQTKGVLIGDFSAIERAEISPVDRVMYQQRILGIKSLYDADGDRRSMRIEVGELI